MKQKLKIATLFWVLLCSTSVAFGQPATGAKHKVLSVDMGQPGCAISIVDYYGGHLDSRMQKNAGYWVDTPPVHGAVSKLGVNFECRVNRQFDNAAQTYGASWDSGGKVWRLYYKRDDEKILAPVSKIYQLQSRNAIGFLRTTDQINGEEDQRVRFYSFCLFREKTAICGDGQSMRLEEPKGDHLPFILRILRSVTFVDDQNGGANQ